MMYWVYYYCMFFFRGWGWGWRTMTRSKKKQILNFSDRSRKRSRGRTVFKIVVLFAVVVVLTWTRFSPHAFQIEHYTHANRSPFSLSFRYCRWHVGGGTALHPLSIAMANNQLTHVHTHNPKVLAWLLPPLAIKIQRPYFLTQTLRKTSANVHLHLHKVRVGLGARWHWKSWVNQCLVLKHALRVCVCKTLALVIASIYNNSHTCKRICTYVWCGHAFILQRRLCATYYYMQYSHVNAVFCTFITRPLLWLTLLDENDILCGKCIGRRTSVWFLGGDAISVCLGVFCIKNENEGIEHIVENGHILLIYVVLPKTITWRTSSIIY